MHWKLAGKWCRCMGKPPPDGIRQKRARTGIATGRTLTTID